MACDLITEIVLIIVAERRKEGRGVERGARGISSGCYMPGTLCKKDRLLMTASYSEARSRPGRAREKEVENIGGRIVGNT